MTLLPHLATIKGVSRVLQLHGAARLKLGEREAAFDDARTLLFLVRAPEEEPFAISRLVQRAMIPFALQLVWEGIQLGAWTDEQLRVFQVQLGQVGFLADFPRTLRAERAFQLATMEQWRVNRAAFLQEQPDPDSVVPDNLDAWVQRLARWIPSGWFQQNKAALTRHYDEWITLLDPAGPRLHSKAFEENDKVDWGGPYNLFAFLPSWYPVELLKKMVHGQVQLDLAMIACGLERYRLQHGSYPASLEVLVPGLVEALPPDSITGEPLRYQPDPEGGFRLYSVGWNRQDDGGQPAFLGGRRHLNVNLNAGDWVWIQPGR
jgi:hypothetical protein